MNKKAFFDYIRPYIPLTKETVDGFDRVLDFGAVRRTPKDTMAYILATAYWESGRTMQPVREVYWKDEAWRQRNFRYYPYYGRGLIQTTWERNYKTIGDLVGVDLVRNPDLLLTWQYALPALFIGMERGLYTGKDLDDYIDNVDEGHDEDYREYVAARRIVNGTDKAAAIADLAFRFRGALAASGWGVATTPAPKPKTAPAVTPAPAGGLLAAIRALIAAIASIFGRK